MLASLRTRGWVEGSAFCKKLPLHSEEGEDPRSWPGTLLGLFWREELPLWCWGQGAWGLLIAYFLGRGGACAGRGCWGVGEGCFSFGVKGCAARFTTAPEQGCFYIIVNETSLAKCFSFGGGCTFIFNSFY